MSIVDVTSGITFDTIAAAIDGSASGDTIDLSAGTYAENLPHITHDLTFVGVGGMAHLEPPAGGLANDEGLFVTDANVAVENMAFSGAAGPSMNDAGIRMESGNLTVINSWFYDNQDGILTNADPTATVTIIDSEFNNNGAGDGLSHNLYVGQVATLDITGSYFHDANGGHEIKSRAFTTIITDTRIQDGPTADANYSVDLPNGGIAILNNDTIEKGANAQNDNDIHYGGEAFPVYAKSSLSITNTTFIDGDTGAGGATFLLNEAQDAAGNTIPATITGDTFYGVTAGQVLVTDAPGNPSIRIGNDGAQFLSADTFLPLSAAPTLDTAPPFSMPCFVAGTGILTPEGEVAVEKLRIGDLVTTLEGPRAVVWIGRRSYPAVTVAANPALQPIRIRTGALGPGVPYHDLLVSPLHALYFSTEAVLIPAASLTNGVSICACEDHGAVSYFHIELAGHAVLLAEGAPAESFADRESRAMFDNAAEFAALYPHARPAGRMLPLAEEGTVVEAVRRRLAGRAGVAESTGAAGPLRGHIERIGTTRIEGWAMDTTNPGAPVELEICLDGAAVRRVLANRYRSDLRNAGLGFGRYAFSCPLPENAVRVQVRRLIDAAPLPESPTARLSS